MAELIWAKNEIRRQRRKASVSYGIMVIAVALAVVCGCGWWTSAIRLDNAKANEERLAKQSTNLTSAVAYALNGRQYESEKNGKLEAEKNRAWGRLGPMQRKINDLQEDVERLRTNWTSELGVEP